MKSSSMHRKKILTAAILATLAVTGGVYECQRMKNRENVTLQNFVKVRAGMSRDQVRGLLGTPTGVAFDPKVGEVWYYKVNPAAAVVPMCIFDSSGVVRYAVAGGP